jgi:hypothetical protein
VALALAFGCRQIVGSGDHHLRHDAANGGGGDDAGTSATAAGADSGAGGADSGAGGADNAAGADSGAGGADNAAGAGGASGSGGSPEVADCSEPQTLCGPGLSTGSEPVVLATDQQSPTSVRIDGTYVYWINEAIGSSPGAVMRVERSGGTPVALAQNLQQPKALSVLPNMNASLFFTDDLPDNPDAGVYKLENQPGGSVVAVDKDGLGAALMQVGGNYLYTEAWSPDAATRIRKSDINLENASGGCYPVTLAASSTRLASLNTDPMHIYFVEAGGDTIFRSGTSCDDTPIPLVTGGSEIIAIKVAINHDAIYWLTRSALMAAAKTVPNTEVQCLASADEPTALAMSDRGIVFGNKGDGSIRHAARVLACGQVEPSSIAVNEIDESLVWTDRGSGKVLMLETW